MNHLDTTKVEIHNPKITDNQSKKTRPMGLCTAKVLVSKKTNGVRILTTEWKCHTDLITKMMLLQSLWEIIVKFVLQFCSHNPDSASTNRLEGIWWFCTIWKHRNKVPSLKQKGTLYHRIYQCLQSYEGYFALFISCLFCVWVD